MKRTIRSERLYSLGDYKNIKFYDEISDIPESMVTDVGKIEKLYLVLMAHSDLSFYRYMEMYKMHKDKGLEEAMQYLEELLETIVTELGLKIENGHTDS